MSQATWVQIHRSTKQWRVIECRASWKRAPSRLLMHSENRTSEACKLQLKLLDGLGEFANVSLRQWSSMGCIKRVGKFGLSELPMGKGFPSIPSVIRGLWTCSYHQRR